MPGLQTRWYQTTWGIIIIGLAATILAVAAAFIILTLRYAQFIKQGKGDQIAADIKAAFSAIQGSTSANKPVDRVALEQSSLPILGNNSAPVTVVEFVDFKCPNCKLAAPIVEQMIAQNGVKVKLIVRHFPIESLHPGATNASLLAQCANEQGLFWPAYNALFNSQNNLDTDQNFNPLDFVALLNPLNQDKLQTCVKNPATKRQVDKDYVAGLTFGVRGTPTFFVNGQKIEGVIPLATWQTIISQTLSASQK